jgi:RNA polymerase sigma-70 factor (ECF subfamily)
VSRPEPAEQNGARSSDSDRPTDETLARFRSGDASAFETVFRHYYPRLCKFVVRSFGVDLEDAEDIVQNAFIKIWRILARLPRDVSTPACLFEITRTQALELLSKRGRRARLCTEQALQGLHSEPARPDDVANHRLLLEQIRRTILSFPQRCRDAFWLRRVGGLSYAEIGRTLGIETRTVETHVREGHRRLRAKIEKAEI